MIVSKHTVKKGHIIQATFMLFLISLIINPVKDTQLLNIANSVEVTDTTAQSIPEIPYEIIEHTEPPKETSTETGINQTQTNKRKTPTPAPPTEANTSTFIVPTHVQAENLLDQGYSVKEIAKELGLDKKEVRKLKRKQKKEVRAAVAQRKKENKREKKELK